MKLPGESDAVARWRQRNWGRQLKPPDIEQIINALMHTEIALAAAEQRVAESEARAERLAEALEDAHSALYTLSQMAHNWDGMGTTEQYKAMVDQNVIRASRARKRIHAALTAPATQPDGRAAAEREVIAAARRFYIDYREGRGRFFNGGSTADMRAIVLSSGEAALIAAVDALDATDGAAKEGA